jgi:uncharacterized protein (DUF1684 family)
MRTTVAVAVAALLLPAALPAAPAPAYAKEIEAWRTQREDRLKADGGWLSVAGLVWLKPGANTFGSGPGVDVELPEQVTVPKAGTITLTGTRVEIELAEGVEATVGGQPLGKRELKADTSGVSDVVKIGRATLQVIERSGRYGMRVKDPEAPQRKAFQGLRWFPVDEAYRVSAKWVPYDPPKKVAVPNILGQVSEIPSPGRAVFTMGGREVALEPVLEEPADTELFFIFRDATAPRETYGAGRFLYAEMPKDGRIVLDFNKAYSPPCAFTRFATCPLPPRQNRLDVRIEAGEKDPRLLAH